MFSFQNYQKQFALQGGSSKWPECVAINISLHIRLRIEINLKLSNSTFPGFLRVSIFGSLNKIVYIASW